MNGINVLVVEDDIPIQQLIVSHFERAGWRVRSADSGRSALKVLEAERIDVILSDIRMPDINGIELLRAIRSKGSPIPLVFLSANDDPEIVVEARRLGAFEYLEKPANMDDVAGVLRRALEKKPLRSAGLIGLNYELGWATKPELEWIHSEMVRLNRQTMNFRMMPQARFLRLTDLDNAKVIGWGGLIAETRYPEVFSLFVLPEYRGHSFGRIIELARHIYFNHLGIKYAYGRMTVDSNLELMNYRIKNKLFEPIAEQELDRNYIDLCKQCELYGIVCKNQKYFRIDVDNFIKLNVSKVNAVDVNSMPVRIQFTREGLSKQRHQPA